MAASELMEDDGGAHVEAVAAVVAPPARPQRPVNGAPPSRGASSPSPAAGGKRGGRGKLSGALRQNRLVRTLGGGLRRRCDYVKIAVPEERAERPPAEWWKTGVAFLYAVFNLVFTTVVITVVHERVPDKALNPPLPDKFFDYVERVPWAFTVTEVNGLVLCALWLVQWLCLQHRYGGRSYRPALKSNCPP